jgi:hypothetical protein
MRLMLVVDRVCTIVCFVNTIGCDDNNDDDNCNIGSSAQQEGKGKSLFGSSE